MKNPNSSKKLEVYYNDRASSSYRVVKRRVGFQTSRACSQD